MGRTKPRLLTQCWGHTGGTWHRSPKYLQSHPQWPALSYPNLTSLWITELSSCRAKHKTSLNLSFFSSPGIHELSPSFPYSRGEERRDLKPEGNSMIIPPKFLHKTNCSGSSNSCPKSWFEEARTCLWEKICTSLVIPLWNFYIP